MGTPFEEVFESFNTTTTDYRLNNIEAVYPEDFYKILSSFMLKGLPQFDCNTSLDFTAVQEVQEDGETVTRYYFNEVLSPKEIMIIAKIMVVTWFTKDMNDVTAMGNYMNQREFKKESSAQNMKQRTERLEMLTSDYMGDIRDYHKKSVFSSGSWEG